jgi:hypothetical protein
MAFSTKLQLNDAKAELQSGNTLTIAGDLRYDIHPNFTGDTQIIDKKYVDDLIEAITGSTSTGGTIYNLASPSNVEVGGMPAGTVLTGRTSNQILEEILVDTFEPTFVAPSVTLTENVANTQEVGSTINITYTATFDRGEIILTGNTQNDRSGAPNTYTFTGISADTFNTTSNSQQLVLSNYVIQLGANNESVQVDYDAGPQPLDSNGDPFGSPLPAGNVSDAAPAITGIYPYFFGNVASGGAAAGDNRPDPSNATSAQTLIDTATKVVAASTGTITVTHNSTSDDYIYFATPATSTTKTIWFVNALNNGSIGGAVNPGGNLYPSPVTDSVDSPTALWAGVNYKIYVSNFQSAIASVEYRNS